MRFKTCSQASWHGFLLVLLVVIMPTGLAFANAPPISPTSALTYSILGNVTYRMEMELKLTNNDGVPRQIELFAPQLLNWSVEVPDGDSFLQTANLLGNATSPLFDVANFSQADKFNNSIDFYQKTLAAGNTFTLKLNYTILTNQIRWNNLGTPLMSDYDTATPFYKLYTQNQAPLIDITDATINQTARMICGGDSSPVEKARKIYNWLVYNLTYQVQADEMGASWAMANLRGDCSEYSDLMVAMLRGQGVPARKVVGLALLDANGNNLPSYALGATWTYVQQGATGNHTGHAWVEYFVPGSGWVACDPTWGKSGDYFNSNDYLHIASCRGEYFGDEVYPTLPSLIGNELGEYPFIPLLVYPTGANIGSLWTIRFTVIQSNIWFDPTSIIIIIGIVLVIAIVGIVVWVARKKRD